MNQHLVTAAQAAQPDAIIVLKGETIFQKTLAKLRTLKKPMVSWWLDDPLRFPEAMCGMQFFDVLYMFDKGHLAELEAQGARRIIYLPCACDPATFHSQALAPSHYSKFNCTIGFIATYDPIRSRLLGQMQGLDVGLWGAGWEASLELQAFPPHTWRSRRVTPTNSAKIYNLASICPNVHHPQTQLGGLNMRTFEVLAAGGFELVDNVPGLEESFIVGQEIVCYTSPAHFRELADYYLAHPQERQAIAKRGQARVLRDHTYEQRLNTILGTMQ
jgi:spore maturation protein CgeB